MLFVMQRHVKYHADYCALVESNAKLKKPFIRKYDDLRV